MRMHGPFVPVRAARPIGFHAPSHAVYHAALHVGALPLAVT